MPSSPPQAVIEVDGKNGKQLLTEVIQALYEAGFHDNGRVVPGKYDVYLATNNKTQKKVVIVRFEGKIDVIMTGQDPEAASRLLAAAFEED